MNVRTLRRPGPKSPSSPRPLPGGLKIGTGRAYGAGYSDASAEALAEEEGSASFCDESVHGPNTALRSAELIVRAHDVQAALIHASLRDQVAQPEAVLERETSRLAACQDAALRSVDAVERAEEGLALVQAVTVAQGLVEPEPGAHRGLSWRLGACAAGDLSLIAVVFQTFGVSDHRPVPLLPVNELQIAASASVFALLYLAHAAGSALRDLTHELSRPGADRRPRSVAVAICAAGAALTGAAAVLLGICVVRSSYMVRLGTDPQFFAFLAVQAGSLAAAVVISYRHSHPREREHRRAASALKRATRDLRKSDSSLRGVVAAVNVAQQRRLHQMGSAIAAYEANTADACRQVVLVARRVQLAQPEPVTGAMFPEGLPAPAAPAMKTELEEYLSTAGLNTTSTWRSYGPVDTSLVDARLAALEARRDTLRAHARAVADSRRAAAARPVVVDLTTGATAADGRTP